MNQQDNVQSNSATSSLVLCSYLKG